MVRGVSKKEIEKKWEKEIERKLKEREKLRGMTLLELIKEWEKRKK